MITFNGTITFNGNIEFGNLYIPSAVQIPQSGSLLAYYDFNQTGTTATDLHSTFDGTVNNGTIGTIDGILNKGYNLTETTGNGMAIGQVLNPDYNSVWSVNGWFKPSQIATSMHLWDKSNPELFGRTLNLQVDTNNKLVCQLANNTLSYAITVRETTGTFTTADAWYMVTVTNSGNGLASGIKIYVNSAASSLDTIADTLGTNSTITSGSIPFTIGGISNTATADPFLGTIDEFGVWNAELTQTSINTLYNSGNGIIYK